MSRDHELTLVSACLLAPGRHESRLIPLKKEWVTDPVLRGVFGLVRARPMGIEAATSLFSSLKDGKARKAFLGILPELAGRGKVEDADVDLAAREIARGAKERHILDRIRWVLDSINARKITKAEEALRLCATELQGFDLDGSAPVGVADLAEGLMANYEAAKASGGLFIRTGVGKLDERCGGGKRGELWTVGGATSDGKTTLTLNMAYNAWVNGSTVLWVPIEMPRNDVAVLFVIRHAMAMFPEEPIDSLAYRRGTLDGAAKKRLQAAAEDIRAREGTSPRFRIWDPPRRASIETISQYVEGSRYAFTVDMLVIDYVMQLYPVDARKLNRESLGDTIGEAKWLAKTYCGRRGLWLVTPHQLNREGQKDCLKRKPHPHYLKTDLMEASRVECESDVVAWILRTRRLEAAKQALVGIAKCRGGPTIPLGFKMYEQYASAYLGDLAEEEASDGDFDDA